MPALPDPELSRAVLIGASRFQHLPDLPAVRNNLADLRAVLTDPEHGIIAPENCLVVEEPASPREFMTSLRQAIRTTDDFLLVYYAGHGLRDDAGDKLYLTRNQTDRDELDGSAVPFDFVKRALEGSRARASLLVLDCCYSGMAVGIMSDGVVSQWEIEIRGSAVLASSPRNKTSHSPKGHRHTAFTGRMIRLLENGSPIKNEPLTVNTLYKRVSVALTKEKLPEPKFASTETSGDLLVRRPTEPRPKPAAPQVAEPQTQVPPTAHPAPTTTEPVPEPVSPPASDHASPAEPDAPPLSVPSDEPPAQPSTVPEPVRDMPRDAAFWARKVVLILWIGFALLGVMFLSGLFGLLFADPAVAGDTTNARIGGVLTVVFGVPLFWLRRRWQHLRGRTTFSRSSVRMPPCSCSPWKASSPAVTTSTAGDERLPESHCHRAQLGQCLADVAVGCPEHGGRL